MTKSAPASSASSLQTKAKAWFNGLDPKRKRKVVVTGIGAIGFMGILLVSALTPDTRNKPSNNQGKAKAAPNLLQTPTEALGLDAVNSDMRAMQEDLRRLQQELEREKAKSALPREMPGASAPAPAGSPDEALAQMKDQIISSPSYQGAPEGTTLNPNRPTTGGTGSTRPTRTSTGPVVGTANQTPPAAATPTMKVVRGKPVPTVAAPPPKAPAPEVYLPTGSVFTGVLLNGMDAPTGRTAQGQPVPAVIRLKHEAILPSRYSSDVREAFILAAGFGDLSSERAYLRSERLSMILNDGRVIDIPVKMAAVGSDGKTGIRGTVVSKQGALIAKAMLAGTAEGISRAFGGNSYGSMGGGYEMPSSDELVARGIGGGTSSALDRVASYFLQQAEAMYPVVEIAAGREVSFILLEGTALAVRELEDARRGKGPPAEGGSAP